MAYDVFLSYNSLDRDTVSRVATELEQRGCKCFIDQSYLMPGRDWVVALENALKDSRSVAVFLGPREMGRWQQRERAWALDRQADDQNFAVIPVLLPDCEPPLGFLRQLMWIDLRQDPASADQLDALAAAIRGEAITAEGRKEPRATVCPYRGLLAFREEDAAFFFGRDTYIDQLVEKVEQRKLVAVVGASGSGKSSVVRAGLVPRLRSRNAESIWEIATMVPAEQPVKSLVQSLAPMLWPGISDDVDLRKKANENAQSLRQGNLSLVDLVEIVLTKQQGSQRLLLVVDQWEELYTQCEDPGERQQFIEQLLAATARDSSPLSIVLTVRSDFYSELLQDRPLLDRLLDARVDLGPMSPEELRSAIEQPATSVGLKFQDGLVDRLMEDARDEPGRLPLLEFALDELWKRQDAGILTHAAYQDLGRLSGAIAKRAEDIYTQLNSAQQDAMPSLFRRLVRAGAKTDEDTRRRADFQSLDDTAQQVVRRLAYRDARLLVTSRQGSITQPKAGQDPDSQGHSLSGSGGNGNHAANAMDVSGPDDAAETVEVAHEELLRRWGQLTTWIDADRKFLQWRARLIPLLDQFERDPQSALLRAGALREARQFYPSRDADLEEAERAFVIASLRAEQGRKFRLWSGVIAAAVLLMGIVLGVRGYVELQERRRTVASAVRDLPGAAAVDVPQILANLIVSPEHARDLLQAEFASENDEHAKLRLAFGLLTIDDVPAAKADLAKFLCSQVPTARPSESANLVRALSRIGDQRSVIDAIIEHAQTSDAASDRTAYLATALSLNEIEPVARVLELQNDPQQRSDFIHNFNAFPGDLVRVAKLLDTHNDPDFRSGLCAALGKVDINFRSRAEREALVTVTQSLYRDAPDGGTHSAAGWALRKWQIELPALENRETQEDVRTWTTNHDWYESRPGLTMLNIPQGEFIMGSSDDDEFALVNEKPAHEVKVSEFWLSDREVTVGLFRAVMRGNDTNNEPLEEGEQEVPVTHVTWHQAVEFCNELSKREGSSPYYDLVRDDQNSVVKAEIIEPRTRGYRLPTEAEWEYACRARSRSQFCFGDVNLENPNPKLLEEYAVFNAREIGICGSKLPNGWGLFDMHGSVWEWCQDWYGEGYYGESPDSDPPGDVVGSLRVRRGGGWNDAAGYCRSAYRFEYVPSSRNFLLGFRVARSSGAEHASQEAEPGT